MKTILSFDKVTASILWDSIRIIYIDYLKKGNSINDEYYAILLQRLGHKITKKLPHLAKKKCFF